MKSIFIYWALGSQKQENLPQSQKLSAWDTELSRADHGAGGPYISLVGARLRGRPSQCPCVVLKRGAGPQGHPLMDLLKQPLAPGQELADEDTLIK